MTERKFTPPTSFPAEYVTRDGVKVTLLAKGTGEAPYCGQLECSNWIFFRGDGSCAPCPAYDLHDLPRTKVQWANDYEEIFGCTWHDSREEADANAMWDCIAVIRREWTEGQPPEYFTEEARMSNDLVKRLRERAKIASEEGNMTAKCDANYFEKSADRIEELEAKLDWVLVERDETFALMLDRAQTVEAKLAKAVVALDKIKRIDNIVGVFAACERTLAELKGEK